MKKRLCWMSRILTVLTLAIVLLSVSGTTVQAAGLGDDAGVRTVRERSILEDADFASDTAYQRTRSLHLAYGYSEISKLDYNRVQLLGTSQCHHVCPKVYLSVFLDRMDPKTGDISNSVRQFDFEEDNVYYLTKSMGIYVTSGYYYSVRGFHSCHHDGVIESTETITDWVYIGKTTKPVE